MLEQAEFLAEEPHARVVVVALGFEAAEFGLALDDVEFHAFDLVMEEAVERHGGGRGGGIKWEARKTDGGGGLNKGDGALMDLGRYINGQFFL